MDNKLISVIITCYNCSKCIEELYTRLINTLEKIHNRFEIIFINDASLENDWELIKNLSLKDARVKGINLSKNFGEYHALAAGIDYCIGEWVIIMDGDLQDQPEEISKLYAKALENFDIVFAKRIKRKDKFIKKIQSELFYKFFSYLTETQQDPDINNFGIYSRRAIDALKKMQERTRFFPIMIKWIGFNSETIEVEHAERKYGKTGYSFKKLIELSIDTIIAFSDKPLRLLIKFGFCIVFVSFIFMIYLIMDYVLGWSRIVPGWSSLIISIWLSTGISIVLVGMVGIYVGKIFDEVKKRPFYIIKDKTNL
ncbi:MAG: glycosyltransferase family 2 protein [Candidatus Gastranaerophilales bacterium]|nr:glycosyltransferase family 2 protein [Candidatus Gastranaerophilales bacterium]